MSISVIGAAAGGTGATTVAIPAHQPGDMIIIGYGSTITPSIPTAGGTVPAWQTLQTGAANSVSLAVVYAIATASNHTSGTWASGKLTVVVLRSSTGTLSTAPARSSVGNANNTQTIVFPALTLGKTDGSSVGVRVGQRSTNAAGLMTPPTGWTIQAFNPASTPNIVLHTRLGLTTNPAADSVSATGTNAPYRAVTVEVQEIPPVNPLDETLIDDFNRADARVDAGAGSTIWRSAWYDSDAATDVRVISNQLGLIAAQYSPAYTLRSVQASCDVVIDCVAPPVAPNNEFGLYFCMADMPSTGYDGYAVFFANGTWILRRYANGASAGNITTAAGTLLAGDSIWVSKVGSALKLYKKASGGNYQLILQATDANHNLPGRIILELSDTTQRWENLRGGPFVAPTRSILVI